MSEQKFDKTQNEINIFNEEVINNENDEIELFHSNQKAAENGDKEAQFNLGVFYTSIEKDQAKAFYWYLKAAENDNKHAREENSLLHKPIYIEFRSKPEN
ncbi:uncharacterized protein OCT59_028701 [Rhizophagus irregularis]|uniref:uncharacterized protein n=1 Tax=Rhizophagus irregularis TaxID=588596 RepID=UPI000CB84D73|nr:hypothetical protein OCT59_028701 [Rhizophagus irregularis]